MSIRGYPGLKTGVTASLPSDYALQGSQGQDASSDAPAGHGGVGNGLPAGAVAEFRFHPKRRWRFDWAWPEHMVALEIEGGAWSGGRHTSGKGFIADMEKYNVATLAGWRVLRVTPQEFESGEAGRLVQLALEAIE